MHFWKIIVACYVHPNKMGILSMGWSYMSQLYSCIGINDRLLWIWSLVVMVLYYSNLKTSGSRFRGLRAITALIAKFKYQKSYSFWGTAAPDSLLQRFITGLAFCQKILHSSPNTWLTFVQYWRVILGIGIGCFIFLCQIVKPGYFHPQFPQAFWLEKGVTSKTSCLNIFLDGEVLIF